jgi:hypothetical protein
VGKTVLLVLLYVVVLRTPLAMPRCHLRQAPATDPATEASPAPATATKTQSVLTPVSDHR